MTPLFAFLHHLAAFALVAALGVELALLRGELTAMRARQILSADRIYGISKLSLFVVVGLLSIYPTRQFIAWRTAVNEGRAPAVPGPTLHRVRSIIHLQLALIAVLILCAALMARGIGYVSASWLSTA